VREATQALTRAAEAHDHVFDAGSTQGFQLAHDLVWRADQAVRLRFLGRMTIRQDMRSAGTVWSSMNRHFDLLGRPFTPVSNG
jgi:hypothetical protein